MPSATSTQCLRKAIPSIITTRRSSPPSGAENQAASFASVSATKRRETALFEVARSRAPLGTGSRLRS
jgi:hypothetical protein